MVWRRSVGVAPLDAREAKWPGANVGKSAAARLTHMGSNGTWRYPEYLPTGCSVGARRELIALQRDFGQLSRKEHSCARPGFMRPDDASACGRDKKPRVRSRLAKDFPNMGVQLAEAATVILLRLQ